VSLQDHAVEPQLVHSRTSHASVDLAIERVNPSYLGLSQGTCAADIGKKSVCPVCLEKVDLRHLWADRPWETRNISW
jgi:hypothetical protein